MFGHPRAVFPVKNTSSNVNKVPCIGALNVRGVFPSLPPKVGGQSPVLYLSYNSRPCPVTHVTFSNPANEAEPSKCRGARRQWGPTWLLDLSTPETTGGGIPYEVRLTPPPHSMARRQFTEVWRIAPGLAPDYPFHMGLYSGPHIPRFLGSGVDFPIRLAYSLNRRWGRSRTDHVNTRRHAFTS